MPKDSQNICDELKSTVVCRATVGVRSPALSGIFILYLLSIYHHLSSVYHLLVGNDDKNDDKLMIN